MAKKQGKKKLLKREVAPAVDDGDDDNDDDLGDLDDDLDGLPDDDDDSVGDGADDDDGDQDEDPPEKRGRGRPPGSKNKVGGGKKAMKRGRPAKEQAKVVTAAHGLEHLREDAPAEPLTKRRGRPPGGGKRKGKQLSARDIYMHFRDFDSTDLNIQDVSGIIASLIVENMD